MKNYVKFIITCIIAAFSLMSCNNDNNGHELTTEEINSIINEFRGHHQGKLISATDYDTETRRFLKQDTIMTEATFDLDTTVTFPEFPVIYLAKEIKNSGNAELKEALEAANSVKASGKFTPASVAPMSVLINYLSFPLEYGGKQHSVTISFSQYYSFAQFLSSKIVMQLLPAAIYVDDNLAEEIISPQGVDLAYSFNEV